MNRSPSVTLSVVRCADYSHESIDRALSELLEPFGGLKTFVKPGQKVLLKPNMLTAKSPEAAATTHPAVVGAVASECRKLGAEVFIGDSPPMSLGDIENYWDKTGFLQAAEDSGAKMVAFEKEPTRNVTIKSDNRTTTFYATELFFKVDLVINLPKLKTHNLTVISGAVKNHFGLLPGVQKAQLHMKFPKPIIFGNLMTEIAAALPTGLTIMDGIEGMDGQGPAAGRAIKTNCLLASTHPVAVDLGLCAVVGLDPRKIPTLIHGENINFGPRDLSEVEVKGVSLDDLRFKDFRVPEAHFVVKIPDFLINLLKNFIWIRPCLKHDLCIKCGACAKICPAEAIKVGEIGALFNRRTCISCFCCMEVCPRDAVVMKSSFLISFALFLRRIKRHLQGKPL